MAKGPDDAAGSKAAAQNRFKRAASLLLKSATAGTLDRMAVRLELELAFMQQHNGLGIDDLPEDLVEQELDEIIANHQAAQQADLH